MRKFVIYRQLDYFTTSCLSRTGKSCDPEAPEGEDRGLISAVWHGGFCATYEL